jgi:hypothetical protein
MQEREEEDEDGEELDEIQVRHAEATQDSFVYLCIGVWMCVDTSACATDTSTNASARRA